jgi:hypothetical protein
VGDGGAGLRQERLAGGGQPNPGGQALQQRAAELLLEALDLLRSEGWATSSRSAARVNEPSSVIATR